MTDTPTETTIFRRHDRVRKVTGDYQIDGTVACAFMTLDGKRRVVVDHRPAAKGMLHIYNPGQLVMIEESLDRSDDPEEMAALGRSLMDAIALATADQSSPLHGWAPAQDPAEVVFELINMVQEGFDWRGVVVSWAVERWRAEVEHRPLVNVHRRALDTTWRQMIRHFGGDPDALVGMSHDALLAEGDRLDRAAGKEG